LTKKLYLLSIASGVLLALSFPPIPLGFLAFVGFIPLLFFIEEIVKSGKKVPMMKYLYITFFIFHVGTNWWISSFQSETDPFLMASGFALDLVGAFFFMPLIYLYRHIRLKTSRNVGLVIFPFVWVLYEWGHSLGEFSYPWQAIGYSQVANLEWVQMADITGVWGISFLIVVVNVILCFIWFNHKENKDSKNNKNIFGLVALLFLILILPQVYGNYKIEEFSHQNQLEQSEKQINIAIIQAAINPWKKWSESSSSQIRKHINLTDSLLNIGKKIDLSLWSETTIMRMSKRINTDLKLGYVQDWANRKDISILSGFVHDYVYKENEARQSSARFNGRDSVWMESFNSAILVQPDANSQVYHKAKLTPFAERIPYVDYVSFLADYIKWGVGISSWGLGSGAEALTMKQGRDSIKIGNIICIESIYPEFCRDFTLGGAEILTIITNDAWYDYTPGPAQHYAIARVRAIEVRRPIARCANTGISGFIAANGETISMANQYQREAIVQTIPAINYSSFYLRYGDWLPWTSFVLVFIIFVFTFFESKIKK
jgi:apolipoprotein N-acyltransferase